MPDRLTQRILDESTAPDGDEREAPHPVNDPCSGRRHQISEDALADEEAYYHQDDKRLHGC